MNGLSLIIGWEVQGLIATDAQTLEGNKMLPLPVSIWTNDDELWEEKNKDWVIMLLPPFVMVPNYPTVGPCFIESSNYSSFLNGVNPANDAHVGCVINQLTKYQSKFIPIHHGKDQQEDSGDA
jgi:hypothetical protein